MNNFIKNFLFIINLFIINHSHINFNKLLNNQLWQLAHHNHQYSIHYDNYFGHENFIIEIFHQNYNLIIMLDKNQMIIFKTNGESVYIEDISIPLPLLEQFIQNKFYQFKSKRNFNTNSPNSFLINLKNTIKNPIIYVYDKKDTILKNIFQNLVEKMVNNPWQFHRNLLKIIHNNDFFYQVDNLIISQIHETKYPSFYWIKGPTFSQNKDYNEQFFSDYGVMIIINDPNNSIIIKIFSNRYEIFVDNNDLNEKEIMEIIANNLNKDDLISIKNFILDRKNHKKSLSFTPSHYNNHGINHLKYRHYFEIYEKDTIKKIFQSIVELSIKEKNIFKITNDFINKQYKIFNSYNLLKKIYGKNYILFHENNINIYVYFNRIVIEIDGKNHENIHWENLNFKKYSFIKDFLINKKNKIIKINNILHDREIYCCKKDAISFIYFYEKDQLKDIHQLMENILLVYNSKK